MNLSIFNNTDPSGKYSRSNYILSNYPNEYHYLISHFNTLNLDHISFKEKVYLFRNNQTSIPLCKKLGCNNPTNFKNNKDGYYEYCNISCVSRDPSIKKIKRLKSIEKYGTNTPSESDEVKQKIIKTNQLKFGHNSPMCDESIQRKSKATLLKNYGVINPSYSNTIQKRRIETFKKSNYKESFKNTSLIKYGVKHPFNSPIIHNKSVITSTVKFIKKNRGEVESNLKSYEKYELIDVIYKPCNISYRIKCDKGHIFKIHRELLNSRFETVSEICIVCNPISNNVSGIEINLRKFISSKYSGEILLNTRSIISPYEIDIYLPELKIGIEFNGLFWHSDYSKENDYHKRKYDLSLQNNIKLITIWEDDWIYRNDVVRSFLLKHLNLNKVVSHNDIKLISNEDTNHFLNENSMDVNYEYDISIGLYSNNELYSILTLLNNKDHYLITNYSELNYHTIDNGFKYLMDYIVENYSSNIKIISDNMEGYDYSPMGFQVELDIPISYWGIVNKKRIKDGNYNYRVYNSGSKLWKLSLD